MMVNPPRPDLNAPLLRVLLSLHGPMDAAGVFFAQEDGGAQQVLPSISVRWI